MKYCLILLGVFFTFNNQIFSQNPCVISDSFTVSPTTPNNEYSPGEIVTICYTLEEFNQLGANWFEGILIDYSSGFVANSIQASNTTAAVEVTNGATNLSCSGNGVWNFHNQFNPTNPNAGTVLTLFDGTNVTNDGSQTYFPGFFYDLDSDANPGNDFGDSDNSACSWTFCFDLEVAPCGNGPLNVNVIALSDGEIGSWVAGANDCSGASTLAFDAQCNDCPIVIDSTFSSDGSGNYNLDCNTLGEINLMIDGGVAPYSFSWNGPNGFSDIQIQNGTSHSISGLNDAGNYTLTLGDASSNNCALEYEFNLIEPDDLVVAAVENDPLCFGTLTGSIEYIVNGGVAPYLYSLNSNPSQPADIFNNLGVGNYNATIQDFNGCEISLSSILNQPDPLTLFEAIQPVSCFGFSDGIISTTVSGGTTPYAFNWTGDNPLTGNGTTEISNLASGNYQIVVTDDNNCQDSAAYFLTENSSISLSTTESDYNGFNVRCYNGNDAWVSCVASGGLLPYAYYWIDLSTNDTISRDADIYNLSSGSYSFTVEDIEGCPNSVTFNLTQPDSLSLDIANYSHKSCTYNNDGFIDVSSWGGPDNPPYSEQYLPLSFVWKGENSFYSTNQNIDNLSEGFYTIMVEDANQCVNELTFEITQPPFVVADYRVLNDTVTTNYPIVNLYDNSEGNILEWQWELSNGLIAYSQDVVNLDLSSDLDSTGIKYFDLKLVVTDEHLCKDSVYGRLAIKEEHTLFVPNGFTPDLDGNNDTFKVFHHAMKTETFYIAIFDRYGSLVFESDDANMEWDGTNIRTGNPLITGTYSYVLSYQDFEYRIYDHTNCENCTGTITLVR